MAKRVWYLALPMVVVGAGVFANCDATPDPSGLGDGANGSGLTGTGGSAAAGGQGAGGSGEGGVGFDAGQTDGNLSDGDICSAEEAVAEKIPLDIFFVLDISGSMSSLWSPTRNAINQFFNDPLSEGINVALSFYPHPSLGSSCEASYYNPPYYPDPIPPLAAVPADNAGLQTLLAGISTDGMTPMYAALEGSYQVATLWQDTYPGHKTIVVLSGDGSPNSCWGTTSEEISQCSSLATSALNYNGVETYCIVLASSAATALNQIAAAGGTGQSYDVSSNVSQFAQVMSDIRDSALGCEYLIPEPEEEEFDPLKVNVLYTPGGGGDAETIPQVANEAACGNGDGWYFDDPQDPTMILLCPATCTTIENDGEAQINIAFGCPTTHR